MLMIDIQCFRVSNFSALSDNVAVGNVSVGVLHLHPESTQAELVAVVSCDASCNISETVVYFMHGVLQLLT